MDEMNEVRKIRQRIAERYRTNPKIRVNVNLTRPKLQLRDAEAVITGVYSHLFQVEETAGERKRHILQYTDVLLGSIEIIEP